MSLKFPYLRILGAAIILIALSFMPSVASAHGGPAHGSQPAVFISHHHDGTLVSANIGDKAVQAELGNSDVATQSHPISASGCFGGCCSGGTCHGCVGIAFVDLPRLVPPESASSIVMLHASLASGLPPGRLRKPPKFFV